MRWCSQLHGLELIYGNLVRNPICTYDAYWVVSDTPLSLMLAGLKAVPILAGTGRTGFDFTLYTGDLVSHDPDNQLSR